MQSVAGDQANFFKTLQSSYGQMFGSQQGILSSINNALDPILKAGPNQMGFSASETADLRGQAINSSAAQNRNEQTIAASSAGGNTGVTTGGEKQLQAEIASRAGTSLSSEENQINLKSAEVGRQNFFSAEAGLGGVASLENPTAYAGATTSAGGQAYSDASMNNQASNQWAADIGGLAGAALGGLGGKFLDSNFAGKLGGGKL